MSPPWQEKGRLTAIMAGLMTKIEAGQAELNVSQAEISNKMEAGERPQGGKKQKNRLNLLPHRVESEATIEAGGRDNGLNGWIEAGGRNVAEQISSGQARVTEARVAWEEAKSDKVEGKGNTDKPEQEQRNLEIAKILEGNIRDGVVLGHMFQIRSEYVLCVNC